MLFAIVACTTAADNPRNIVPIATETPVRDSLISQEFYPDGKLKSRCVFAATDTIEQINPETLEELVIVSVSTGTTCWYYYANGKLSRSEQHDENKKIGEWESYDSLGNWLKTEVYMNGTLIKKRTGKTTHLINRCY